MSLSFQARGGWWVVGQSMLMVAVVGLGAAHRGQWSALASFVAGWMLFAAGGCLGVWGMVALGRNRTAFPRPIEDGHLVRTGPYAIVRHPLYASVILASFGWALIFASASSLAVAAVLTAFFHAKAAREERWLRTAYPDYEDYSRQVRGLIPWVW